MMDKSEQRTAIKRVLGCPNTDYYRTLDVGRDATDKQIRVAYRRLSLLTHPDKTDNLHSGKAFESKSIHHILDAHIADVFHIFT
jgi:preprotein translocase subunit Sec63